MRRLWIVLVVLASFEATAKAPMKIAIVKSRDLAAYAAPVGALRDALAGASVVEHTMDADTLPDLGDADLIVALGGRALYHTARATPRRPVVFAMVLSPRKYLPMDADHVAGVGVHVPPEVLLTSLKLAAPSVKRVGVVVHASSTERRLEYAAVRAGVVGVKLVRIRVDSGRDVKRKLEGKAGQIDALWMPADPVAVTRESHGAASSFARRSRIPLVAWSGRFVQAGALMSVAPSYRSIGSQLGLVARRILEDGASPKALGIAPPIGTRLVVNAGVAAEIGLALDDDLLESADEVIEGDPGPRGGP